MVRLTVLLRYNCRLDYLNKQHSIKTYPCGQLGWIIRMLVLTGFTSQPGRTGSVWCTGNKNTGVQPARSGLGELHLAHFRLRPSMGVNGAGRGAWHGQGGTSGLLYFGEEAAFPG